MAAAALREASDIAAVVQAKADLFAGKMDTDDDGDDHSDENDGVSSETPETPLSVCPSSRPQGLPKQEAWGALQVLAHQSQVRFVAPSGLVRIQTQHAQGHDRAHAGGTRR